MQYFFLLFTAVVMLVSLTKAQQPSLSFVKNKGQIVNQNGEFNSQVKYVLSTPEYNVSFYTDHFSYELYSQNVLDSNKLNVERIELWWGNSTSKKVNIKALDKRESDHVTYYKNGQEFKDVLLCERILYQNVWKGVDIEFLLDGEQLKYNFIVKNKTIGNLDILVKGAKLYKNNQTIEFRSLSHVVKEELPEVYYINSKGKKTETELNVNVTKNKISYELPTPRTNDLVIDPVAYTNEYTTYYGGAHMDFANDIHTLPNGDVLITGYTVSTNNIATTGSYQTTLSDQDAFIAVFNNQGVRQWATYFGGGSVERIYSSAVDTSGNIIIAGNTTSIIGLATQGAYQQYISSADDGFLAKFTPSGQLLWSTYYGGDAHELIIDVATDVNNKIYVTGHTASSNLNCTPDAFRNTLIGFENIFLGIFDAQGNIVYNSYYLTGNSARGEVIAFDNDANIYIAGATNDTVTSPYPNVHQTQNGGYLDGFIIKINPQMQTVWKTYLGGWHNDLIYAMTIDSLQNIYVGGKTKSNNNIATSGGFQSTYESSWDGFVVKLDTSATRLWGTYINSGGDEEVKDITMEDSIPWVLAISDGAGFVTSSSAYQATNNGGYDNIIVKFDGQGNALWSSYYGGDGDEFGHKILIENNKIILVGQTGTTTQFTTSNAHQTVYGGHIYDGFWTRLCLPLFPTVLTQLNDTTLCAGDSLIVSVTNSFSQYLWSNGSTDSIAIIDSTIDLVLETRDANNCPGKTDTLHINVLPVPSVVITAESPMVCYNDSVMLTADSTYISYLWYRSGNALLSDTLNTIYINDTSFYYVKVINGLGCEYYSDTMMLDYQPVQNTAISVVGDTVICTGGNVILSSPLNDSLYTYQWSTQENTSSISVDTAGGYWFTAFIEGCEVYSDTVNITEISYASPGLVLDTSNIIQACYEDTVVLQAESGFVSYQWSNGATSIQSEILQEDYYYVVVTDSNGCVGISDSVYVDFLPLGTLTIDTFQGTVFCEGTSLMLTIDTVFNNPLWNNTLLGTDTMELTMGGMYYVQAIDTMGCEVYSDTVFINELSMPDVEIIASSDSICLLDSVYLSTSSNASIVNYQWSFGGGSSELYHQFGSTGYHTVSVMVTDTNGCQNQTQTIIQVVDCVLYNGIAEYGGEITVNYVMNGVLISMIEQIGKIKVYDTKGSCVISKDNVNSLGVFIDGIKTRGVYLVHIETNLGKHYQTKIFIQ